MLSNSFSIGNLVSSEIQKQTTNSQQNCATACWIGQAGTRTLGVQKETGEMKEWNNESIKLVKLHYHFQLCFIKCQHATKLSFFGYTLTISNNFKHIWHRKKLRPNVVFGEVALLTRKALRKRILVRKSINKEQVKTSFSNMYLNSFSNIIIQWQGISLSIVFLKYWWNIQGNLFTFSAW